MILEDVKYHCGYAGKIQVLKRLDYKWKLTQDMTPSGSGKLLFSVCIARICILSPIRIDFLTHYMSTSYILHNALLLPHQDPCNMGMVHSSCVMLGLAI